jgi:drug/metabolite transporter (DMT)-like permease
VTHRRAVLVMVCVALMWSIAGVVSRQLETAHSLEVTFWRSLFNALALVPLLTWWRGPSALMRSLAGGGRMLWLSGLCWCVMFTAFMMAITMTTVANVLVTMSIAPLFTALASRFVLGHALPPRTWAAILLAGLGIAWMYAGGFSIAEPRHLIGTVVALAVPVAAAINWTVIQHNRSGAEHDLLPAVLIGALLSVAISLPFALPMAASGSDLAWLALLGVVQLAIPCLLAVVAARHLSAPEVALLALLEVIFGVAWAWLGANEAPSMPVLGGGALVLAALAGNEALALRGERR